MNKHHVVVGTGPLGLAVIEELIQKGSNVTAINRSEPIDLPPGVPFIKCDMSNKSHAVKALDNADVVYHCIGLPYDDWALAFPKIMSNLIFSAEKHQFKIVYADNLYAYGPQNKPLIEEIQYNPIGIKTNVRADVALQLMQATKDGNVVATIGRGADFYGPRVQNATLGQRVFLHLLEEKPVEIIGNPNKLHAHLYIKDFARGLVILGEEDRANNEIWHIPHPKPTTTKQLIEKIALQLNTTPKYRIASRTIVSIMGIFNKDMRHFKELLYQTSNDYVVNSRKFESYFTFENTPYEKGIEETIEWYRSRS